MWFFLPASSTYSFLHIFFPSSLRYSFHFPSHISIFILHIPSFFLHLFLPFSFQYSIICPSNVPPFILPPLILHIFLSLSFTPSLYSTRPPSNPPPLSFTAPKPTSQVLSTKSFPHPCPVLSFLCIFISFICDSLLCLECNLLICYQSGNIPTNFIRGTF